MIQEIIKRLAERVFRLERRLDELSRPEVATGRTMVDDLSSIANGSATTLTSSYQTIATSGAINLPAACRVLLIGNGTLQCTAFTAAQDTTFRLLDNGGELDLKVATVQAIYDRATVTLMAFLTISTAAAHTFTVEAKKGSTSNTIITTAGNTEICWVVFR